jgi:hypothetical protein
MRGECDASGLQQLAAQRKTWTHRVTGVCSGTCWMGSLHITYIRISNGYAWGNESFFPYSHRLSSLKYLEAWCLSHSSSDGLTVLAMERFFLGGKVCMVQDLFPKICVDILISPSSLFRHFYYHSSEPRKVSKGDTQVAHRLLKRSSREG